MKIEDLKFELLLNQLSLINNPNSDLLKIRISLLKLKIQKFNF